MKKATDYHLCVKFVNSTTGDKLLLICAIRESKSDKTAKRAETMVRNAYGGLNAVLCWLEQDEMVALCKNGWTVKPAVSLKF